MNNTKVVTLLTVGDIKILATTIAVEIVSAQMEVGEELDQDEIERIVEDALNKPERPERHNSN